MYGKKTIIVIVVVVIVATISSVIVFGLSEERSSDNGDVHLSYVSFDATYIYDTWGASSKDYSSDLISVGSDQDVLYIQSALEGYPLKTIQSSAFLRCSSDIIVIPSTVEKVSEEMLNGCSASMVVFLCDKPSGFVFSSGMRICALEGTEGWDEDIEKISLETYSAVNFSLNYFVLNGEATIQKYISGSNIIIPEEVTSEGSIYSVSIIGAESFRDSDIISIILPDSVSCIGTRAFYGCESLVSVHMSDSIYAICDEAFRNVKSIDSLDLEDASYIGFEAFRNCESIILITIPDSVTLMGDGAFYVCLKAVTVIVGSGMDEIPNRTFGYCTDLQNIEFKGTITVLGAYSFYMCESLASISLPYVKVIGPHAFSDCKLLEDVELELTEVIGDYAFNNCRMLQSLILPEYVKSIGSYIVLDCRSLSGIYFLGNMPEMKEDSLSGPDITVYITSSCEESWRSYNGQIEVINV